MIGTYVEPDENYKITLNTTYENYYNRFAVGFVAGSRHRAGTANRNQESY
jgi:hypothetical protein